MGTMEYCWTIRNNDVNPFLHENVTIAYMLGIFPRKKNKGQHE